MGKDRGRKCVPECLKVAVDGQWEDRSVDGISQEFDLFAPGVGASLIADDAHWWGTPAALAPAHDVRCPSLQTTGLQKSNSPQPLLDTSTTHTTSQTTNSTTRSHSNLTQFSTTFKTNSKSINMPATNFQ